MDEVLVAVALVRHHEAELQALAPLPGVARPLRLLHARLEVLDGLVLLRLRGHPLVLRPRDLHKPRLPLGEQAVLADIPHEAEERLARPVLVALDDLLLRDVRDVRERVVRLGPSALRILDDIGVPGSGTHDASIVVLLLRRPRGESAQGEVVVPEAGRRVGPAEPLVLRLGEESVLVRVVEGEVRAGADGVPELVEQGVVADLRLEGVDQRLRVGLGLTPLLLRVSREGGEAGPVLGLAAVVALPLVSLQAGDGVEVVEYALVGVHEGLLARAVPRQLPLDLAVKLWFSVSARLLERLWRMR